MTWYVPIGEIFLCVDIDDNGWWYPCYKAHV